MTNVLLDIWILQQVTRNQKPQKIHIDSLLKLKSWSTYLGYILFSLLRQSVKKSHETSFSRISSCREIEKSQHQLWTNLCGTHPGCIYVPLFSPFLSHSMLLHFLAAQQSLQQSYIHNLILYLYSFLYQNSIIRNPNLKILIILLHSKLVVVAKKLASYFTKYVLSKAQYIDST